ncbi:MAG: type II toxin-antitoxin system PemK/MazF family toxin [Phycisphaerae bacterium]
MADPRQGEVYAWPAVKDNDPMGSRQTHGWVVVSRDAFNESSGHVLACPLTSYAPHSA